MADIEYKINRLTESLMDDYGKGRVIDEIKMFEYPDRDVVIDILEKLRIVIYPGYYRNRNYRTYTVRNNISILLEDIIYNLIKQTSIVLKYAPEYSDADDQTIAKASEEITFKFLDTLPKIREYIETDIQAAYDGDPAAYNKDEIICTYPGLFAIFTSRVAHELFLLGVPMIPRIMTEHAHSLTGIDIHPGTTIGKYFFIDHGTGQNLRGKKRHPTICDNVTIYSGASILGGETVVGKNVVVGGNAFITTSIPEGAKVSVKSQELMYNYDSKHPVERKDVELDDAWFYVI